MSKKKRAITVFCAVFALLAAAAGCGKNKAAGEHFGEPFTQAPAVPISRLLESPDAFRRQPVRVSGTIERQCPVAGCWFFLSDGQGRSIKVELGDYLPKLPQRLGRRADVEGEWIKKGAGYEFIGTRVTFE